jgi:two-component system, NtrC family, response regulator AtoC
MERILIIDDDDAIRRTLALHLRDRKFEILDADTIAVGRKIWSDSEPDLVLLDLKLPDGDGTSLLEERVRAGTQAVIIMITGHREMQFAVQAMKGGAFNYIHKPLDIDELDAAIQRAVEHVRARRKARAMEPSEDWHRDRIAGQSKIILELHKQIGLAAKSPVNVLIRGESGTGKELVAHAIHNYSSPEEPFVAVNCSAIVSTLFESELFGHEKGAFTGAVQRKIGRLELAANGTLFLDEIGDLNIDIQARLLRVLQERTFERVGGTTSVPFSARVIAATNRNLQEGITSGSFREDLYFRLAVVDIELPPLREHREDIPELVSHLLEKINRDLHRRITRVPDGVMSTLKNYSWPGNVRELENVLTQTVLRSPTDTMCAPVLETNAPFSSSGELRSLSEMEKDHIRFVLRAAAGNLGRACEVLGVSRPTLRKKMADYGISEE